MANTIAKAMGIDKTRRKETHRLGSVASYVEANTWRTFITAYIDKDGSGYVEVRRDCNILNRFDFPAE